MNEISKNIVHSRSSGIALLILLFSTGFVLMGFEMLGARYLNPWFGGGITTWASLISVVLLAMMAGYMGGGTIADRSIGLRPMAAAICAAGLYMAVVAWTADAAMDWILTVFGDGFWGVLTGSFLLCFVPVLCLAGLSPYVVKLLLTQISHGGRITGLVYSVSTAGNIVGTLATTFWLIPAIGTRSITQIFALILVSLALILLFVTLKKPARALVKGCFILMGTAAIMVPPKHAQAGTISILASYPEGPLWVGDTLYYAEMTADRISRWSRGNRETFWTARGCGPTAITTFGAGAFAVNCHLGGKVVLVSVSGNSIREIVSSDDGTALRNPNDINSQGHGPVFFSDPGPFSASAKPTGRVYRLDASGRISLVAQDLHYANGIAFDTASETLYVSEHLAKRVRRLKLDSDFKIVTSDILLDANALFDGMVPDDPYAGPDGLRLDTDGSLYVALYGAGQIVRRAPDGTLKHTSVPMKYVTSIALSPNRIAVTGAFDSAVPPSAGQVLIVDRTAFERGKRVGF